MSADLNFIKDFVNEIEDHDGTEILGIKIVNREDTTPLRFISRAQQVVYDQLVYAAGEFIKKHPNLTSDEFEELKRTHRKARG